MIRFLHTITSREHVVLLGVICLFILLRLPSVIEPYWYGDEGIYTAIADSLSSGHILYKDIWDNKPPLLYLIYTLFQGDLFFIKSFSIIVGIGAIVCFRALVKKIISSPSSILISTILFSILLGLPLLEGNIANAENFMVLPIVAGFLIALSRPKSPKFLFISGVFLSIAILIKIVAVFDTAALIIILGFYMQREHTYSFFQTLQGMLSSKATQAFFIGIVLLPLLTSIYFLSVGAFTQFLESTFATNVGYVGFENHFIIPQGLILLKLLTLFASLAMVYAYKSRLSKQGIIIIVWMLCALFSVFFSSRPYTHYVLMGILPFCILVGYSMSRLHKRVLFAVFAASIAGIVYVHFPLYEKNIAYYQNYLSYLFGNKNFAEYTAFFDRNAVHDYELSSFINTRLQPNSEIYFWSDSGFLYRLTNTLPPTRYVVSYHLESYPHARAETIERLQKNPVKYIISTRPEGSIPSEMLRGYTLLYTINRATIYEKSN